MTKLETPSQQDWSEDALRLGQRIRKHQHPEEAGILLVQQRGDFLILAQGEEVLTLTKKQIFANLQKIINFGLGKE